jgi:hypothetical protein
MRTGLFSILTLLPFMVWGSPVFHPSGANLTYGDLSNTQNIFSATVNPAAGATVYSAKNKGEFRFGILSSVGGSLELGGLDGVTDDFAEIQSSIDELSGGSPSLDDLESVKTDFDTLLQKIGGELYIIQMNGSAHSPIAPFVMTANFLGGSFVVDVNAGAQSKISFVDSPVEIDLLSLEPATNSSFYLKSGMVAEYSIGYSWPIINLTEWLMMDLGRLYGGTRFNFYQVALNKSLFPMNSYDQIQSKLIESFTTIPTFQYGYGIDAGLLMVNYKYRLGLMFENLNSPTFNYDTMGENCLSIPAGEEQDSCFTARLLSSKIDLNETHTMNTQLRLEGAMYTFSQNWVVGFSLDLNETYDLVGNPVQRFSLSGAYATRKWLMPGARLGFHTNLSGSALSHISAGMTFFKSFHLDVAYGLQTVVYEGTELPRKLAMNLGFDMNF